LGTELTAHTGQLCDFAIVDFNFVFDMPLFELYMKDFRGNSENLLIFVDNVHMEEVVKRFPPSESRPLKISNYHPVNGAMLYY
jgi:hypothetical protein